MNIEPMGEFRGSAALSLGVELELQLVSLPWRGRPRMVLLPISAVCATPCACIASATT